RNCMGFAMGNHLFKNADERCAVRATYRGEAGRRPCAHRRVKPVEERRRRPCRRTINLAPTG
ncbi:MAG: hypothetical protein P8Z69_08050, partial [Acidihalobacter sp.]